MAVNPSGRLSGPGSGPEEMLMGCYEEAAREGLADGFRRSAARDRGREGVPTAQRPHYCAITGKYGQGLFDCSADFVIFS